MPEFQKILIANRGEIAIRIMRAANEMGKKTVAIFAEEDKLSLRLYHVGVLFICCIFDYLHDWYGTIRIPYNFLAI